MEKLDPKLCPLRQSHTGQHRDHTPTDPWLIWGNQVFPLQLLGTEHLLCLFAGVETVYFAELGNPCRCFQDTMQTLWRGERQGGLRKLSPPCQPHMHTAARLGLSQPFHTPEQSISEPCAGTAHEQESVPVERPICVNRTAQTAAWPRKGLQLALGFHQLLPHA